MCCGMREIEVMRSDGLEEKFIKVLKFKGDYFIQMFTGGAGEESLK